MNKRIKKKRKKLKDYRIGDHIYTHKEIDMINKTNIGYMNAVNLYRKIKESKLTRGRVRALINYIYKNRMKYYKHIFASRVVTANDIFNYRTSMTSDFTKKVKNKPGFIPGGKKVKYNSSTFISASSFASNSCEAASMEVD